MNQVYVYIHLLFFKISFLFRSPQSVEQSSLCHAVGSHQLSILYIVESTHILNMICVLHKAGIVELTS